MARKIVWSIHAIHDLIEILNYWNQRLKSNDYSIKLNTSLENAIHNLGEFPNLGRKFDKEIHFIIREHHYVFYAINDLTINILHIWDSRRNPKTFKKPKNK